MIEACQEAGVKLMYAECLCFAPKYVRLKELLDSGALGTPTLVKQSEKHGGPHAAHFWDTRRSGGGVTMDIGCHAIQFFRWMLDRTPVTSVYAQMSTQVHADKTVGDDNALLIVEFEGGTIGLAEESWTKLGGMDDRAEVHGSKGVAYADLLQGGSIQTYSEVGYGLRRREGRPDRRLDVHDGRGALSYGFPQELDHFARCVRDDREPLVDRRGRARRARGALRRYESARTGAKVALPFTTGAQRPIDPLGVHRQRVRRCSPCNSRARWHWSQELRTSVASVAASRWRSPRPAADVACSDIGFEEQGHELVELIEALGRRAAFFRTDVSERAEVDGLIADVEQTLGPLDIACSNAGTADWEAFHEITDASLDRIVGANLTGAFNVGQAERACHVEARKRRPNRLHLLRARPDGVSLGWPCTERRSKVCERSPSTWRSSSRPTESSSTTSAPAG